MRRRSKISRSRSSRPHHLIYLFSTIGLILLLESANAQDDPGSLNAVITGSGTIIFRHRANYLCNRAILVPVARTTINNIATSGNRILMDWQYDEAISKIRKTSGAVETSCNLEGAFEFSNVRSGNYNLFAHFHWLRGKWASGGWLAQEIVVQGGNRNVVLHGEME